MNLINLIFEYWYFAIIGIAVFYAGYLAGRPKRRNVSTIKGNGNFVSQTFSEQKVDGKEYISHLMDQLYGETQEGKKADKN